MESETKRQAQEQLDWQYHCRELQVTSLNAIGIGRALAEFETTPDEESSLEQLMVKPPVLLSDNDLEEIVPKARSAAAKFVGNALTSTILTQLRLAASQDVRTERRLSLHPIFVAPQLDKAFASSLDTLRGAINQQREKVIRLILDIISKPNTPLLRFRRNLIDDAQIFSDGRDTICHMPTVIPNVDVEYRYSDENQIPEMSIVVKPF